MEDSTRKKLGIGLLVATFGLAATGVAIYPGRCPTPEACTTPQRTTLLFSSLALLGALTTGSVAGSILPGRRRKNITSQPGA